MPEARQLNPLTRAVLLAFSLLLLGLLFQELVTLLIAILVTVLIAIPLSAMAGRLERYRVPRSIGALIGLVIGIGAFAGVIAIVIPSFADQADQFVAQVPAIVDDFEHTVADITGSEPSEVGTEIQSFLERYTDNPQELIGPLASLGLNVAGVVGAFLLMLITAYYMAVRPRPLVSGFESLFPPDRREWAHEVMSRLRASWIGWMQGVLFDMVLTGVLLYAGLELIGLDFAIFFAVFSAVLVLIPYFGAIVGAVPPTLFALTDSPEKALLTLGIYVVIQQVESNVTIPLVMANRVKLHPALVAIGVVVIGQLFGFLGLFVAVPILSLIVIVVDEAWVRPMESSRGVTPADPGDVARAAAGEEEPQPEGAVVITPPPAPQDPSSEAPSAPRAS
jgi:predicted PurR-regulated permease PerM